MLVTEIAPEDFTFTAYDWMYQELMNKHQLLNTDVLVYAVIHEVVVNDQKDDVFEGPISYIAEVIGSSIESVRRSIDRLTKAKQIRECPYIKPRKGCKCYQINGWPLDF